MRRWPVLVLAFTFILLTMFVYSLMLGYPYSYWTDLVSVVLLWVPFLLAWKEMIELPQPLVLGIGIALSLHSLGVVTRWYDTTEWWSHMTHFVSGIVVASLVATFLLLVIHQDERLRIPIRWVPFFIFISVLALEGVWKIFEFTMDLTAGTMMQHGLEDLMNDNLSDTLAGIVAGLATAFYLRHSSIDEFVAKLRIDKSLARFRR